MTAERGFYSLIQYVPDHGRAEGANVGVAVVCPALGVASVVMSPNNEGPAQRFGKGTFDDVRLRFAKEALMSRLRVELSEQPNPEGLLRARSLEANSLVLSEPRTLVVDADLLEVAKQLCTELVFLPETHADRGKAPSTKRIVRFLQENNVPIQTPGKIRIPVTEEALKVAFAFDNGSRNYVHAHGFSRGHDVAMRQARDVGAYGQMLFHHSSELPRRQKLIVLANLPEASLQSTVKKVLATMHVDLVLDSEQDAFARHVLVEAKASSS
jgi:hypothetical protein